MVLPRLTHDLPRPFNMEGMVRKDDAMQHKAVREAVTNAIIHADFMMNGLLRFEKYDDRLVLTNPGLLKLPIEQIYAGGESKARNQRMQNMLRMIGYGENIGSGFPLILNAWNEKHWMKPELIEQPELMQVKLTLHIMNEEDKDKEDKTDGTINGTINGTKEQSERQQIILSCIADDHNVTIAQMAQKTGIPKRTILRDIAVLQEKGIIMRKGARKNGYWEIINKNQKTP